MLLIAVVDTRSGKRPGLDVAKDVGVVPEGPQAGDTTDKLLLVNTTQHGETGLGRQREAEAGSADEALAHEAPNEVLVVAVSAHLGRKPENAVLIAVHTVL